MKDFEEARMARELKNAGIESKTPDIDVSKVEGDVLVLKAGDTRIVSTDYVIYASYNEGAENVLVGNIDALDMCMALKAMANRTNEMIDMLSAEERLTLFTNLNAIDEEIKEDLGINPDGVVVEAESKPTIVVEKGGVIN